MKISSGAARRTQEQRSAETRARILDATIECLVRYGYNGTTTPRVAEMAGVTRGAQVHHFGSKNDLVVAALRHLAAKRTAAVVGGVADLTTADDPIGDVLDLLWELHQGPLFVATVELWVAGRTDAALGREVAKFESIVIGNLMTTVAQFSPDSIHKALLDFLYTAMDALRGILIASFVDPDPDRARRRWDRAAGNLRMLAEPLMAEWDAVRTAS
jgi:AcrR family transcriptional regulator